MRASCCHSYQSSNPISKKQHASFPLPDDILHETLRLLQGMGNFKSVWPRMELYNMFR